MSSCDAWQTSFVLSLYSNCVSTQVITESTAGGVDAARVAAQTQLTTTMRTTLATKLAASTDLIGNWQVVWGPVVYVHGAMLNSEQNGQAKFTQTNAMFVAWDGTRYVVAVAATNATSVYDWAIEDFTLTPAMKWTDALAAWAAGTPPEAAASAAAPQGDTSLFQHKPAITAGTYTGVSYLLQRLPDPNTGVLLVDWLNTRPNADAPITVVGHSLGGALSPTLALALCDPDGGLLNVKPQVQAYPSAGATPGNQPFADHYFSILKPSSGAQSWQNWNAVSKNQFDLVPSAWTSSVVSQWAADYKAAQEYTSLEDLAVINGAPMVVAGKALDFATWHGSPAHLVTASVSGVLNPNATPQTDFYWSFPPSTPSGAAQILTKAQAAQAGISTTPAAIPLTQQILLQHIKAYSQIILPGISLP